MKDKILGRPIIVNKKTLAVKKGKDYAELVFIGDVHLGSPQCNVKKFLDNLRYCLYKKIYVILMGDLLEVATRESIGAGVYEQDYPALSQFEIMFEYLKPLADAGLILGLHQGNHEERIWKMTGFNISKALARELNVPYLGDACWNYFKVGNQVYKIYTLHGRTNARYEGTALTALERLASSFDADIVAMGHAHKLITSHTIIQKVVNGSMVEFKKHLIITGSYLNYTGSYGQKSGLNISKIGSPKVKLFSKKHDIHAST